MKKELITLGTIVRPHGVRGEVKVLTDFDNSTLNPKLKTVFIDNNPYKVLSKKFLSGGIVLKIDGLNTVEDAESFRNKQVFISHDDLIELDEDEYYIEDLIGCVVCFEDGEQVGKIKDVQNFGASDILVIKNGTEETMCPLVEDLLVEVDLENGTIVVNKTKYLEVTVYED